MNNLPRPPPRALAELFRRWSPPGSANAAPEVEAVFSAGHSNRNFLVRVGTHRCVVRLAEGDPRRFGIDREAERRVLELAAELGLGAPVLWCEPARGTLVTAWLPSRALRVEGIGAGETLDRLASALRRLHAQELAMPLVNVVDRIRVYAREVQADDPRNWPRARRWLGAARPVMEQYRFSRWREALCHNDLVGPNILDTDQGCASSTGSTRGAATRSSTSPRWPRTRASARSIASGCCSPTARSAMPPWSGSIARACSTAC